MVNRPYAVITLGNGEPAADLGRLVNALPVTRLDPDSTLSISLSTRMILGHLGGSLPAWWSR